MTLEFGIFVFALDKATPKRKQKLNQKLSDAHSQFESVSVPEIQWIFTVSVPEIQWIFTESQRLSLIQI